MVVYSVCVFVFGGVWFVGGVEGGKVGVRGGEWRWGVGGGGRSPTTCPGIGILTLCQFNSRVEPGVLITRFNQIPIQLTGPHPKHSPGKPPLCHTKVS